MSPAVVSGPFDHIFSPTRTLPNSKLSGNIGLGSVETTARGSSSRFHTLSQKSIFFQEFHDAHQRLYAELRLAYDGYYQNPEMLPTINRLKGEMLALQRNFSHMFMQVNETHVTNPF